MRWSHIGTAVTIGIACMAAISPTGGGPIMSNVEQLETVDSMQGSSYQAIQGAVAVFRRHGLDLARYGIEVVRDGDSDVVVFTEKGGKDDAHKRLGVQGGTNRELTREQLETLLSRKHRAASSDKIQGSSFPVIQAATAVFSKRLSGLEHYGITLVRQGTSLVVVFQDRDTKPGGRGNTGSRSGFEVELDSRDMKVLRSNFVR
jgi:hypothetical protein